MTKSPEGVTLDIPAADAPIALFMVWMALGEALRMLGEKNGNSGWNVELYDRCQSIFDSVEQSRSGDQSLFVRSGIEASTKAIKSGSKAIDAAFDRVTFK